MEQNFKDEESKRRLIAEVKKYNYLYDPSQESYHIKQTRATAWAKVSAACGCPGSGECIPLMKLHQLSGRFQTYNVVYFRRRLSKNLERTEGEIQTRKGESELRPFERCDKAEQVMESVLRHELHRSIPSRTTVSVVLFLYFVACSLVLIYSNGLVGVNYLLQRLGCSFVAFRHVLLERMEILPQVAETD